MIEVTYTPLTRDNLNTPSNSTLSPSRGQKRTGEDLENTRSAPSPPSDHVSTKENILPPCSTSPLPSQAMPDASVVLPLEMPPQLNTAVTDSAIAENAEDAVPHPTADFFDDYWEDSVTSEELKMWVWLGRPTRKVPVMPSLPRRLLPRCFVPYAHMEFETASKKPADVRVEEYMDRRSKVGTKMHPLRNEVTFEEGEDLDPLSILDLFNNYTVDPFSLPTDIVDMEHMNKDQSASVGNESNFMPPSPDKSPYNSAPYGQYFDILISPEEIDQALHALNSGGPALDGDDDAYEPLEPELS